MYTTAVIEFAKTHARVSPAPSREVDATGFMHSASKLTALEHVS